MIKFSKTNIENTDIETVNKILKSGWLTHGKYTTLFEEELKKYTKSKVCDNYFKLYVCATFILFSGWIYKG